MNRNQKLFGVSLLALIVSGCAITSEPIERSVSEQRARTDLHNMHKDQEPLNGPLTLHQAMARAVKYNLEGRLKLMEEYKKRKETDLNFTLCFSISDKDFSKMRQDILKLIEENLKMIETSKEEKLGFLCIDLKEL